MKKMIFIVICLALSGCAGKRVPIADVIKDARNHQQGVLFGELVGDEWVWFENGDETTDSIYKGEIRNGLPNGKGTLILPDGKRHVGEFKDGKTHGQGTYTYSSGDKYVGEMENGVPNGQSNPFSFSSGTKQWTQQLGTSTWDEGKDVTTDSSGNIYVTGWTGGGLDGNTNSGNSDIFLVKFNSSGTKQWTKQLGTSSMDFGSGVTTDSSGNIYVTGYTRGGLDGNTNSGSYDIFLVKYNSSGTKQWTKQLGTSSDDWGNGVSTDSSGNIYVTGYTYGSLDGNTNSYASRTDIFLVKYNSSGTKQWTKQLGTSYEDRGNGVTTDSSGNIYVTGYTEVNKDKRGLDGNTHSGWGGVNNIFLVKYNSSGTKQWTKQLGYFSEQGTGVTTDSSGNIYVTGHTQGCNSCSKVMATRGLDGNTNFGSFDIFLVKYNSSGTKQWTKQLGTSYWDLGESVTTDSSDNIYVTGFTDGGLDGNTNYRSECKHPPKGEAERAFRPCPDIFLVKYNSSGTKQWTKQLGTSSVDKGRGVTTDSSDNIYVTGGTDGDLDGNTNSGSVDIFLVKYNSDGVKQ